MPRVRVAPDRDEGHEASFPANRDSASPRSAAVPRRSEQPAQVAGRSSRFIAAGKEEEDIAEQLIAVLDQGTDNTILPVFRCALQAEGS